MKFMLPINNHKDFKKHQEYFSKTTSSKRLSKNLLDIAKTGTFQQEIKEIRKLFDIPDYGYASKLRHVSEIPIEWRRKTSEEQYNSFIHHVSQICKKNGLMSLMWSETVRGYVFYNEISPTFPHPDFGNHCLIIDELEFKKSHFYHHEKGELDIYYPISIRIDPNITLTQLREFLTKDLFEQFIEPILTKYREPASKVRSRKSKKPKNRERNAYVVELRSLGKKISEITKMTSKKFKEDLTEGHIRKILSLEKGRASNAQK